MGVPVARIGRKGSEVGKETKRLAGSALKSSSGAVWIVWEAGVSRDPFNRLRIKITHDHHLLVLLATSPNNDPSHKKSATVPTIRSAFQSQNAVCVSVASIPYPISFTTHKVGVARQSHRSGMHYRYS